MKKTKLFILTIPMIAMVSGSLAIKALVPGFKLCTCNFDTNKCVITDPTHNYRAGVNCPFIPNAGLYNQPPVGTCEEVCPGVRACPEQ